MDLIWAAMFLLGGVGMWWISENLEKWFRPKTPEKKPLPAPPTTPQLGPYRTADVIHRMPAEIRITNADELLEENRFLREVVQRLTICADREMWRQGMLDATAVVARTEYILPDILGGNATVRSFVKSVQTHIMEDLRRYADHPEESRLPMLPISPYAARKVGTLPK